MSTPKIPGVTASGRLNRPAFSGAKIIQFFIRQRRNQAHADLISSALRRPLFRCGMVRSLDRLANYNTR